MTARLLCLMVLVLAGTVLAQPEVTLELSEWPVPWEASRPRDPHVDQMGRVWFCGQTGNYLAYFDPVTSEFVRYDLPANTGPHNLIVDEEGFVWYAGNRNAHIGKLDPATGAMTRFDMPDALAQDPHTLIEGNDGDIWFTVQQGNAVGRLMKATGDIDLVAVPTPGARPYGIKVTQQNRPWIVLLGTNKLATLDPETLELSEITLPRTDARPRRLEITADGVIWYVDYAGGFLGSYDPASETFQERALPGGAGSRPYGTALDGLGHIWIAETGTLPNRLVGFDPVTESFFGTTEVPSGGAVRHMYFHAPTQEIWFGTDTNFLVRARVSP